MVIRGNFQQLSLAMYGTIVSEMPPPPTSYEPQSLPSIDRTSLPDAFDLSNTEDPTILARSLLRLSSPSLRLPETVRATWCGRAGYDEETEPMIDDLSSLLEQSRHWPGDQEADDAFLIDLDQYLQQEVGSVPGVPIKTLTDMLPESIQSFISSNCGTLGKCCPLAPTVPIELLTLVD
jgi:hypothetical protein